MGYFQCATAPLSSAECAHILPDREGCWDTALVMSSFRLDQAGRLIVGGVGNLDAAGGKIHEKWAQRKLRALFPQLKADRFAYRWYGQMAMTSDHVPKVVKIGPNAYACFGYSGRGIGPGTIFGAAIANALLTDDPSRLPLSPVSRHREPMVGLREAYFELGATLVHGLERTNWSLRS